MSVVFRVDKKIDYTVIANSPLRDKSLSNKALGLLVRMLSLPPDWDFTQEGLAVICKDGVDAIRSAIDELKKAGYIECKRVRNEKGYFRNAEYTIREVPFNELIEEPAGEINSTSKENAVTNQPVGTLPCPTLTGYSFGGWYTQPDGEGDEYTTTTVFNSYAPVTLYAYWQVEKHSILFTYQGATGGNTLASLDVTSGQPIGELPAPTRTGYSFDVWYTGALGTGTKYTVSTIYQNASDTTLYANWTADSHVLTFYYENATSVHSPASMDAVYGQAVGTLPAPTRTGYTFGGWFTQPDGGGSQYVSTTIFNTLSSVDLYAYWIGEQQQLLFDYQNATGNNTLTSVNVTVGQQVGTLPAPTRTGYSFDGWYTGTSGTGTKYTSLTVYQNAGDTTLYANWKANTLGITFHYENATGVHSPASIDAVYGQSVGTLPEPTRTGYTFGGWFTQPNGNGSQYVSTTIFNAVSSVYLYAYWIGEQYQLLFDYQSATGNNSLTSVNVTVGQQVGTLPAPKRTGYSFDGWYIGVSGMGTKYTSSTVYQNDGDTTLFANWIAEDTGDTSEVTDSQLIFHYNGASSGYSEAARTILKGESVGILPSPVRTGYTFAGWHADDGALYSNGTVYQSDNDTDLYAYWTANGFTITFDYQGTTDGADEQSRQVSFSQPVGVLPYPSKEGYVFDGWYTNPDGQGDLYLAETVYSVDGSLTLYANWGPGSYNLVFNYQGANETLPTGKKVSYGQPIGYLPKPTRDGFAFDGWYTLPDGGGVMYTDASLLNTQESLLLYANWTASYYSLTYYVNGGNGSVPTDSKQYRFNEQAVVKNATLTRDGYTFGGWNISTGVNRVVYQPNQKIVMNGNIKLYAYWISDTKPTATASEPIATKSTVSNTQAGNAKGGNNVLATTSSTKTFTVTYYANGGIGTPPIDSNKYTMNAEVRVMDATSLSLPGYKFAGWCISPWGSNSTYMPGHHFWISRDYVLYAIWIPE